MNNIENDSLLYTTCPKCAKFPKLIITSNKESPLTLICDNCKYTSSFHIPDYISLLSKNHPSLPSKQCSLCKHETPKHFCIECSLTLCNTCSSKHSKSNDNHQILNTNIQIETTCSKHKDYYVTFYCKQCSLYHCELCNENEHKKHKSINICDIYDTHFTETKIKQYEEQGLGNLPICIAKTQYSLSDDPTLLGKPSGFIVTINELIPNTGSGFLVAISGDIMRMPGLPKVPAAVNMDIDEAGTIVGLF